MAYTVLALESSCDEYAGAVVRDGREVLSSVVASQAELHAAYGGVVPEVAGREHLRSVVPTLTETLAQAGCGWDGINAIAVTQGPGLGGSLLVGINTAKALAWARDLPCIPVHHIEGHLYANWLQSALDQFDGEPPPFPLVFLAVSGGHTELLLMHGHGRFERLGQTLDDAAGEAFDKAARLLGLPFPGGPEIERAASEFDGDEAGPLPRAWLRGTYNFSFSGLKTALLHRVRAERPQCIAPLAREFQAAVVEVLADKTARAAEEFAVQAVLVAGGVAANGALRAALQQRCPVPVRWPPAPLCTDNAAMIAAAAYYTRQRAAALDFDLFSASGASPFSPRVREPSRRAP